MNAKPSRQKQASKLAYSYRRYSSSGQRDGSTLQRQLEMAQEVATEKGWTFVDLPPDEAMSGYKGINKIKGTLGSFLKRVRKNEVPQGSVLIIEKMDRFSRNEVDLVVPDFLSLLQSGIEIYSCVDRTHYTLADIRKPGMLLQYAVMAMQMANDYSKALGERVKRSVDIRLEKAKQGVKVDLGPWKPRWIDWHKGEYAFNDHAANIKRIVNEYIHGKSMYGIAQGLVKDNVPTLKGGKWCQGTIGALLANKALTGDIEINETLLKGYVPPVITPTEYDKLTAKLRENKLRKGGNAHSDRIANLFRNRVICQHCGRVMEARKVLSHGGYLYTCRSRRVKKCNCKHSVSIAAVEMDFFLSYLQQTPGEILRANTTDHSAKVSELQASIAKYDKEISAATELLGTLPLAELRSKLTALENKRQSVKVDLDKLNASNVATSNAPKALQNVKDILRDIDFPTKCDKSDPAYKHIVYRIKNHLLVDDTRKKMLALLPSIVSQLIVDTTNKRYAVVSITGMKSPWRSVA